MYWILASDPVESAKVQQWHLALMAKVSGAMDKGRTPRNNRYPRHQMTPKAIQINSVMNDILKCCFSYAFHVFMIIFIIPPWFPSSLKPTVVVPCFSMSCASSGSGRWASETGNRWACPKGRQRNVGWSVWVGVGTWDFQKLSGSEIYRYCKSIILLVV